MKFKWLQWDLNPQPLISKTKTQPFGKLGQLLVSNSKSPVKCVTLNSRPCQARTAFPNISFDETLFYLFTICVKNCGRRFYTINDTYARVCVPDEVKSMNATVFYLVTGIYETRFIVQNKSCKYKCRLNNNACNSKQKWNREGCRCECKELDNWSSCEQDYMWNLSTCDCECNKAWKINEYLDVGNYFCEKRLIGK